MLRVRMWYRRLMCRADKPFTYNQCMALAIGALLCIASIFIGAYWHHHMSQPTKHSKAVQQERLNLVVSHPSNPSPDK